MPPVAVPDALLGSPSTMGGPGRPVDAWGPFVVVLGDSADLGALAWWPDDRTLVWFGPHDHEHVWQLTGTTAEGDTLVMQADVGAAVFRPLTEADQWVHGTADRLPLPALVLHARALLGLDRQ